MFFSLLMCSQFYVRITADDKLMCYGGCSIYTHKLLASVLFYYFPRPRRRNRAFLTARDFAERKKKINRYVFHTFCRSQIILYAGTRQKKIIAHRPVVKIWVLNNFSENLLSIVFQHVIIR